MNTAHNTTIIAVVGKGGVGKTSVCAAMTGLLASAYPDKRILAIDADPAVGLTTALGVEVTMTIDDIRREIVASVEDGETRTAIELLGDARYRIFDALVEEEGFSFLAIGRPESAGCYCKINSYLREVISLISGDFDYVVVDGEAGIEQINRRVMEKVTHILVVTDASRKGANVAATIRKVADELVMYEKLGAIVNRLPDESVADLVDLGGIPVLSRIAQDPNLAAFDIEGRNILQLPADSPIVTGVREALGKWELI